MRLQVARMMPVALMGILLLASVWWDGAFDLRYWAPLTLLALALLLALAAVGALEVPRHGPLAISLLSAWAFAAFVLLSAIWADSADAAWAEAARTVFYSALWTIALAVGARGTWREWLGAALTVGIGLIAVITLVGAICGGKDLFLVGRLNSPIGYRNGTAALFALGAWPMIGYASRRGGASGLRALAYAGAVLTLGLAFLTQSRGVVIGLALGGVVSLAIGPDRLRRAWTAIAAVITVAAISGVLLDPYDAFTEGAAVVDSATIGRAATALFATVIVSFLAALLVSVYDNGLRSSALDRRFANVAMVGLVLVVIGGGMLTLAKIGSPIHYAETKLDEFNDVEQAASAGSTRLGSVGGQRSDLWRVAWDQFKDHPFVGDGAGSYQFAYYRERHTDRNLDDTHSLPLRILADLGLAGAVLFTVWIGAMGLAIVYRAREVEGSERMWVAGLAAAGTTVLAQCLTDWLWLLPGLLGISILAFGLAAGGERPVSEKEETNSPDSWTATRVLAIATAAAALVSVTFLFLGDLYMRKARVDAFSSPSAELSDAETASFFNPVSVSPLYLQASAQESEGKREEARRKLEEAHDREPSNFVPLGLLGDFEIRGGNEARARVYYREALALNPLDVGLQKLSRGVE